MSQPWFPFYVGDYLRDTARLTTEAHGAYLLLILDYWSNGAPPDDDETLCSIARLSLGDWQRLRQKLAPFFQIEAGRWNHKRIDKERETAAEKHLRRVNAGRAGGNAKATAQQSSSNATAELQALSYQSQSQPQSDKKELSRSDADAPRPAREPSRFDEFWTAYPRRDGPNPRKPAAVKFDALVKSGGDPQVMIDAARKLAADEAARGNIGTRFVPQAVTWLNQQRWDDHAAVAAARASEAGPDQIEEAVRMFARIRRWSRWAGPEPGMLGCRASVELLAKHGLGPDGRKLAANAAA
ncbi:YdaU family protein [Bradyrhizobium sp. HKCCYLRH2015]|uniref:YdaU family protein n=1 Tax=Bradyrhizobium sp. HKCCYLRH2015 TaxID=3420742 RepID=UPI003EBBD287